MALSGSLSQHSPGPSSVNVNLVVAALVLGLAGTAYAGPDPAVIQIYNGLGTPAGARIWGRVLEDEGERSKKKKKKRSWLGKLKDNYRALESDEIPHAELELVALGKRWRVKADEEGLFELVLPGPLAEGKHPVTAKLVADGKGRKRKFRATAAQLLVFPKKPGVAVISDIDDTVLATGVQSKLKLIKHVLLTDAGDLKTFPHAPALYRVWAGRGHPVVFVSGSPVNLYPKLTRFFQLKGFPAGPLLLKNLGTDKLTEQRAYKLGRIARAMALLPGYKLLLVGDDGEQDPEIYDEVRRKHPGRVVAVMIHKVSSEPRALPKRQIGFSSYKELARVLARRKLLDAAELARVEGKK